MYNLTHFCTNSVLVLNKISSQGLEFSGSLSHKVLNQDLVHIRNDVVNRIVRIVTRMVIRMVTNLIVLRWNECTLKIIICTLVGF